MVVANRRRPRPPVARGRQPSTPIAISDSRAARAPGPRGRSHWAARSGRAGWARRRSPLRRRRGELRHARLAQTAARGLSPAGHAAPVARSAEYIKSSNFSSAGDYTVSCGSATVGPGAPTPMSPLSSWIERADTLTNALSRRSGWGGDLLGTATSYGAVTSGQSASVFIAGANFAG